MATKPHPMMRMMLLASIGLITACQSGNDQTLQNVKPKPTVSPQTLAPIEPSNSNAALEAALQQILHHLYLQAADQRIAEPQLRLSSDSLYVASCKTRSNQIILESKALNVCRQFGKDSTAMLSFLLGHELGHLFAQRQSSGPHAFFNYYRPAQANQREEGNADLYGLFLCQLAGHHAIKPHLPRFIERLYQTYHFSDQLQGYPSKNQRRAYTQWLGAKTDSLVQIWETGLFMMGLQQFAEASACFEYLSRFYQGAEVWHNWGTAMALQALQWQNRIKPMPHYPYLANQAFRLEHFRGPLLPEEENLIHPTLKRASDALTLAQQQRPQYRPSLFNLLMVQLQQQEWHSAEELLRQHSKKLSPDQGLFFQTLLQLHDSPADSSILNTLHQLSSSTDDYIAQAAQQNLNLLEKEASRTPLSSCPPLSFYPDQLKPSSFNQGPQHSIQLNDQFELYWTRLPHSVVVHFKCRKPIKWSGIQIVDRSCPTPYAALGGVNKRYATAFTSLSAPGSYPVYTCAPVCGPALKMDQRRRVKAWAHLLPTW